MEAGVALNRLIHGLLRINGPVRLCALSCLVLKVVVPLAVQIFSRHLPSHWLPVQKTFIAILHLWLIQIQTITWLHFIAHLCVILLILIIWLGLSSIWCVWSIFILIHHLIVNRSLFIILLLFSNVLQYILTNAKVFHLLLLHLHLKSLFYPVLQYW